MNLVSQEILPLCSSILNSKNVVFTVLFPYILNLQGKMCKTVGPKALVGGFGDSEECQDSYFPLLSVFALILAKAFCAVGSDKPQGWDRCVFTLCLCKSLHFKKISLEASKVEQMFKSITKCAKPVKKRMGTNSCIKQTDNTLVTCCCYVDTAYGLTIVMQRGTPSHRGVEAGIHDQHVSCWSPTSSEISFFPKQSSAPFLSTKHFARRDKMKHYQRDYDKHILANKYHVVCDIYAAPFPRTICVCFLRVVNTPLPGPQSTRSVHKITMIAVIEPTAILHHYAPINSGCVPHTTWRWQWSYSSVMDCWDCVRVLMLRCVFVAAKKHAGVW